MPNPIIADNRPKQVTLTQGEEYYFCTCGRSKKQPFCDGGHAGTPFKPKAFTATEDGVAYLCACKHAATTELMQVMACACGHSHLNQFTREDLATWHRDMALLSGVDYSGYGDPH